MKQQFIAQAAGYYKVQAASSDLDHVRLYKDRVRLTTRVSGDPAVHEWIGPLAERDLIEAEGEALTLTVTRHDPTQDHQSLPDAAAAGRPVTTIGLHVAETIHLTDPVA